MINHPFHKKIGEIVSENFEGVIMDTACGGNHRVSLFYSSDKSLKNRFCDADIVIIKNNKIKIVIEIEESNTKPNHICGKFLSTALSNNYDGKTEIDNKATLIQIVDTSKLTSKSSKDYQWQNIEEAINKIIPVKNSKIVAYKLFFEKRENFDFEQLNRCIKEALSK